MNDGEMKISPRKLNNNGNKYEEQTINTNANRRNQYATHAGKRRDREREA